jgi:hypothetical protein
MINSVIFREDVEPDDFIAALAEKDLGLEVLADYLDERFDEVSIFKSFGSFVIPEDERTPKDEEDDSVREDQFELPRGGVTLDEVSDSDWMELTWRLAHNHPDEFFHVYQILAARAKAAEQVPVVAKAEDGEAGVTPAADNGPAAEESAL